jgi:TonB family protein
MNLSFGNKAAPAVSGASHPSARAASGSIARGNDSIQPVGDGDPGQDWLNALSAWVEAHKYYPREAAADGEDGTVVVRVRVDRSGRVQLVELRDRSGSQWLDLGLQAMFRGARLPPFPPDNTDPNFTFDFTMHYVLIRQ